MSRDGLRWKTVPVQGNPSLGELVHDGTFGALSNGPPVPEGVVPVTGIVRATVTDSVFIAATMTLICRSSVFGAFNQG